MGASIINASGSSIPNLIVNEIKETKVTKGVILEVPASNQDILQQMGDKNRRFIINGWAYLTGSSTLTGSNNLTQLQTARSDLLYLVGKTGSLSSDIVAQIQVLYLNVDIDDKGGRPFEFKFGIDAVEII